MAVTRHGEQWALEGSKTVMVPVQVAGNGAESEGCLERGEERTGQPGRGRIVGDAMDVGEEVRRLTSWFGFWGTEMCGL